MTWNLGGSIFKHWLNLPRWRWEYLNRNTWWAKITLGGSCEFHIYIPFVKNGPSFEKIYFISLKDVLIYIYKVWLNKLSGFEEAKYLSLEKGVALKIVCQWTKLNLLLLGMPCSKHTWSCLCGSRGEQFTDRWMKNALISLLKPSFHRN